MKLIQTRQCSNNTCRFRFPWTETDPPIQRCPRCHAPVLVIHDQRASEEVSVPVSEPPSSLVIHALLDNIRSTFNVGSILRSGDGAGVARVYLCGTTPTPDHPKVAKTALGAEAQIAWSWHANAVDLAQQLQAAGAHLWALEAAPRATALYRTPLPSDGQPLVLIVGHEVAGVDPDLLSLCEEIIALPMLGHKQSLNVAIAFGIASYGLRFVAR